MEAPTNITPEYLFQKPALSYDALAYVHNNFNKFTNVPNFTGIAFALTRRGAQWLNHWEDDAYDLNLFVLRRLHESFVGAAVEDIIEEVHIRYPTQNYEEIKFLVLDFIVGPHVAVLEIDNNTFVGVLQDFRISTENWVHFENAL